MSTSSWANAALPAGGVAPVVALANYLHFTFTFGVPTPPTCIANIRISSDGNYYESDNGGSFAAAEEAWLEEGSAGDVWLSRTITSGTLDTDDVGTGRVNLGSGAFDLGVTAPGGTSQSATFTLTFHDAASGGNVLDTADISVSADASGA